MMKKTKIILDILMIVLLMFVMAFQVTEVEYHEWLGTGALILFLIHNILNYKWYGAIAKGKYSFIRALRVVVNLGTVVAILLTGYSGMVLSKHVFPFIQVPGGLATARQMHLAASYLSFALMGLHLGMHGSILAGKLKQQENMWLTWILRVLSTGISIYGAVLFGRQELYRNIFLINHFAIFDYEASAVMVILGNMAMFVMWCYVGYYLLKGMSFLSNKVFGTKKKAMYSSVCLLLAIGMMILPIFFMSEKDNTTSWGQNINQDVSESGSQAIQESTGTSQQETESETGAMIENTVEDGFILVKGGTFSMGSPESENWRVEDEILHQVTVGDFYISPYEVTGALYQEIMGTNPSNFIGENLPVENVSWLDAVAFCNALSEKEGLTPVYQIDGNAVSWDRGANGYRLPTEAEWEYACRAGTTTPFNTEDSIGADRANFYGHYPYEIENNYFSQENLTTKPGDYRQTTVAVDSFESNKFGLYNMHGNVSEWVFDYYGEYDLSVTDNPTGPSKGTLKVYRGGGWNDFAKNMRSAYRGTLEADMASFNVGIRLVRNAASSDSTIVGSASVTKDNFESSKVLIAYFSWSGNTRGAAEEIQRQTGADLFEITLVEPYSSDYNTVLDESQRDQNIQARPDIAGHIDNMEEYDTILLGYPNWWASIPMPIATFLEEYDFQGKKIVPFCSHGGGRFGQSITAIAKLAPDAVLGEGLSIHYSGGSSLSEDIGQWLMKNQV